MVCILSGVVFTIGPCCRVLPVLCPYVPESWCAPVVLNQGWQKMANDKETLAWTEGRNVMFVISNGSSCVVSGSGECSLVQLTARLTNTLPLKLLFFWE